MICSLNPTLPTGQSSQTPDDRKHASEPVSIQGKFRSFSGAIAHTVGSPWAFMNALLAIIVWAIRGPRFHYSDTWQLVINTGTTIITFLEGFPDPEYIEPRCPRHALKLD